MPEARRQGDMSGQCDGVAARSAVTFRIRSETTKGLCAPDSECFGSSWGRDAAGLSS